MNHRHQPGSVATAILTFLQNNPAASNAEIKDAIPYSKDTYISEIRRKHGYLVYRTYHVLDLKNRLWLMCEAKRIGVSPQVVINSLITDARLDEKG